MKDTKFSIALPNGKDEKNVAKLIRWALKELPSDKAVQIDQFLLEHPYTSDGKPTISVDYDLLDESMINLRNQNIKDAILVGDSIPEIEYAFDLHEKTPLNCLTRRMPAGMQQDDSVSLLRTVARDIEQLGNVEILDLIYHDFLDDNVVSRPYVNVYFRRQSS